ncbi:MULTISPECIES: amidohydrolase family protein [Bizionia]|uniref:Amidohydrolase family protein n=1 Tax=Bizionia algoritergicola TaxID=291187 RepID=A0A5D0QR57_9FLAO|nr:MULTISPECIES: amidohydrolase family protein [Bizionia]OBX17638.1 amidohydrolase [Bizionia sp. APA-3]TYB71682.1 amidohydrolase family protein [Bizionia algoritergicola]
MKHYNIYILVITLFMGSFSFAQQTPESKQTKSIAIVGATAHIGNGQVIENSVIVFENGKITSVNATNSNTSGMTVIDAKGKHVYPGFIAANSALGLVEVDAVRASDDQDEVGGMIPHVRSLIAYNTESKVVESMRPNGVLMAQVSPKGGRISGTSSIVQLDAWNWEDAAIKADDAIHLNWPSAFSRGRWWLGEPAGLKPNKDYAEQINEVTAFINDSKAYLKGDKKPINLPFEAMQGLYNGKQKLFVHVNDEKGITDAIHFAKDNNIEQLVIVGGAEAHKVTDLLKQNKVPVLINTPHTLPANDDQDYDMPFKLAKLLHDADILVGIQVGNAENFQTRNLPFYAGTCAAYGMDKEDALKLITSHNARILGIDAFAGTLEAGKDATLFISEGDALDMRTNVLTEAFIQGRQISLESHQTELWRRYSEKYKNQ